jgi:segregation and condensation protein B
MATNQNQINSFIKLTETERKSALEALIFASSEPVDHDFILKAFDLESKETTPSNDLENIEASETKENIESEYGENYFDNLVSEINSDLSATGRPFAIVKNAGGYLFSTRPEYGELLQSIAKYKIKRRLSQAALETLAIIAYKQPITKPEIEQVRGVNSNEVVNSLIDKDLVEMVGRKDVLGKPLMYGVTRNFLQIFGLNSIEELPKLREIDEILADEEKKDDTITLNIETEDKPEYEAPEIPDYDSLSESEKNSEIDDEAISAVDEFVEIIESID